MHTPCQGAVGEHMEKIAASWFTGELQWEEILARGWGALFGVLQGVKYIVRPLHVPEAAIAGERD